MFLDAPLLGRAAAVVRNGCAIDDGDYLEPGRLKRTDGCFTSSAWTADKDADLAHAVLHGFARRGVSGQPSGVGRALARALEAGRARGAPGQHVAVRIGDGDDRIVEAALDVGDSARHVLAF